MWAEAINCRGVVRASHIHFAKIKTTKISSEECGRISTKFCTSENFPLHPIMRMNARWAIREGSKGSPQSNNIARDLLLGINPDVPTVLSMTGMKLALRFNVYIFSAGCYAPYIYPM